MHDWRKVLLREEDSIATAIRLLDSEALRIVLVVDEDGRLLGSITDGDIRRALLRNSDMTVPLAEVMYREPTRAAATTNREELLSLMERKGIWQIPLVDEHERVVGLETLQHLIRKQRIENPVYLVAGGLGKRLRPLTDSTPKPMLRVGEKPILETILEQIASAGFENFYISTHYKPEMIRDHFGNGEKWGVSIEYVHEEKPLGTGGGLSLLPSNMPHLPLLMMNADLLTKVNFLNLLKFHTDHGGAATMCVRSYENQIPYGVIETSGHQIVKIKEKPVQSFFVNAGIYVISPELVSQVKPDVHLDITTLLEEQIETGVPVNVFPLHEYWLDIGRVEEFERAQIEVRGVFR